MKSKVLNLKKQYELLLQSVPALVTTFFVLSVVIMNLMANKVILQEGDILAIDGGYLISWIPFLCMDCVTKHFGAKASIFLNILAAGVNILCVLLFSFVSMLPGNGQDYSSFNEIFGGVWFITLGSMIAYIASGVVNSLINEAVGKLVKDKKSAFFIQSYISTFIGQAVDNFLFYAIVYFIFAPRYWGWGLSLSLCAVSALICGLIELGIEAVFSPIGYKICKKWKDNNVGAEYLDHNLL